MTASPGGRSRLAVPHAVDGPKVTLGVVWFIGLLLALSASPILLSVILVPVAGAAAYQTARAWERHQPVDPVVAAVVGAGLAASAAAGATGLGVACVVAGLGAGVYGYSTAVSSRVPPLRAAELLLLAGWPAGLAAGSLLALALDQPQAFVSLVLLVSAYEVGDFIVASGSANAYEGPIAGLAGLALVAVGLHLVLPHPFTTTTMPVFAALTGVCAVLGQVGASGILPTGTAFAPGLRRLDSYLLAAPLWLLLIR